MPYLTEAGKLRGTNVYFTPPGAIPDKLVVDSFIALRSRESCVITTICLLAIKQTEQLQHTKTCSWFLFLDVILILAQNLDLDMTGGS